MDSAAVVQGGTNVTSPSHSQLSAMEAVGAPAQQPGVGQGGTWGPHLVLGPGRGLSHADGVQGEGCGASPHRRPSLPLLFYGLPVVLLTQSDSMKPVCLFPHCCLVALSS